MSLKDYGVNELIDAILAKGVPATDRDLDPEAIARLRNWVGAEQPDKASESEYGFDTTEEESCTDSSSSSSSPGCVPRSRYS